MKEATIVLSERSVKEILIALSENAAQEHRDGVSLGLRLKMKVAMEQRRSKGERG